MKIPASIVQGDTVSWIDAAALDSAGNSITSSDYTLTWYFAGATTLSVVSAANGTGWKTTLSAAQTAALVPSATPDYYWQAVASKAGSTITVGSGRISVSPALTNAAPGYDGRTASEIDLANVRAAIRARISGGAVAEYTIGSRRLRNEPISELLALESRLKLEVSKDRRAQSIANGLGDPRNTFVRFG